ncbi:thiamine pyrophosphate-dependent enzyme [Methanocella conradii]|uniref:thiamine pyrophosphate-dependent enzyme n=1 Tax=Methanocella conradii TaxID=1175444 RepID=UPI00157CFE92|nr:thiamine pyrophosphate-dependent enzyme [Methanocella conradii]
MMEQEAKSVDGAEAAHLALKDGGAGLITGVPGYPINRLFSILQDDGEMRAQWQFNEKIAYEMAVGASVMGGRAAVISKHVGVNVMADPLITSATHGLGAGVVVIAGDDVGALQSQNEQDSRWYGKLAEIPVYDPSTPGDLYDAIIGGFELSESISAPVLIRVTNEVFGEKGDVSRKKPSVPHKKLDKAIWGYTMYGKRQKYLRDGWNYAAMEAERSQLNRVEKRGPVGIISSGHASALASKVATSLGLSHLSMGLVNPFPSMLVNDFLAGLEYVLVCEEASPFIEEQLSLPRVKGRLTGHLPRAGPLDEASIRSAIENIDSIGVYQDIRPETLASRGYAVGRCEGCPYGPVYEAIKSLGVPVSGDMGCSILAANPPYSMLDAACSLGSAVSTACGFSQKGIAMIGDFAILHTGLQALVNARLNGHEALVVVFANREAAMTGGQALPDIAGLLKDIFKEDCIIQKSASLSQEKVKSDLEKLLMAPGLKLYVITASCPPGHKYTRIKA